MPLEQNLHYLTCPLCNASGQIEKKDCQHCQGLGIVAWDGRHLLYFQKKIGILEIFQEKVKRVVENLINITLLIVGLVGILSFGWLINKLTSQPVLLFRFWQIKNWQIFLFWFSLITDCYLFYRLQRSLEKFKYISKRRYESGGLAATTFDWLEIKSLKREQKINIVDYFDNQALLALHQAWQLTNKYNQATVSPLHLLIALLGFEKINVIFGRLGLSFEVMKKKISRLLAEKPPQSDLPIVISLELKRLLFLAYLEAWRVREKRVGVVELLTALVASKNEVSELLYDLEVDLDKIKNIASWIRVRKILRQRQKRFFQRAQLRPKGVIDRAMTAVATPYLDRFSQDLTQLAAAGYLAPCVNRESEIKEVFRILEGGRGVILVGNPGVGRTTIVEGIAQLMVAEDVPRLLQDKRLVSLSAAKLISGTSASGAEERLLIILNEIRRAGNIVLFIKDVHNLVGITSGGESSLDLAGVLASTLSRRNILFIATSNSVDYSRYIEFQSALGNVLEKVEVGEVSGNQAIQILEAKSGYIEYRNQVYFSYDAISKAVELSDRYLHERYLPEKAVNILEEVAVRIRQIKGKDAIVSGEDVALIISEKTKIPLTKITEKESEKLLSLEKYIHQRIVDQEEAVKMVAASIRRARAEMRDISRPIVNLLFLGPTGVGKTELAKTVAEVYFGAEENMIRLDMSEYQDKSSVNRLIGSLPGHRGTAGGYLTDAVRKNPFSLLLLDEIEKAYPDILNLFLQVMDDGRLTDAAGRTVDFTNVILIGTSNACTDYISKKISQGLTVLQIKKELLDGEIFQYFRPEFINRFDGVIVFKPLTMSEVFEITKLLLNKVAVTLEKKGITLEVTPEAINELAQAGFDPQFGARPLRRVIQEKVSDVLTNYILAGKIIRRDTAILGEGGQVQIRRAKRI